MRWWVWVLIAISFIIGVTIRFNSTPDICRNICAQNHKSFEESIFHLMSIECICQ